MEPPQLSASGGLSSTLLIRIFDAFSGLVHTIGSLSPGTAVQDLKAALQGITSVPPDVQILLVGPPYDKLKNDVPLIDSVSVNGCLTCFVRASPSAHARASGERQRRVLVRCSGVERGQ